MSLFAVFSLSSQVASIILFSVSADICDSDDADGCDWGRIAYAIAAGVVSAFICLVWLFHRYGFNGKLGRNVSVRFLLHFATSILNVLPTTVPKRCTKLLLTLM